jgi:hypothetical protein
MNAQGRKTKDEKQSRIRLEKEQKLLEECHALSQPHATNMDITRKRLNLLVATVDARLPDSAEQQAILQTYYEAVGRLRDWENGCRLRIAAWGFWNTAWICWKRPISRYVRTRQ